MAAHTAADIIIAFPEFADIPIATIDTFIALGADQISSEFGLLEKYAGMLMTAHLMTVAGVTLTSGGAGGAASGPVASVSVGEVSVNYASSVASGSSGLGSLGLSKYGQELLRIRRAAGIFATVI
jgi:hypothetical protein